jgi:hypothetical protein
MDKKFLSASHNKTPGHGLNLAVFDKHRRNDPGSPQPRRSKEKK